jgi:hypothetical protein
MFSTAKFCRSSTGALKSLKLLLEVQELTENENIVENMDSLVL